jgi:hypothetical protein
VAGGILGWEGSPDSVSAVAERARSSRRVTCLTLVSVQT